MPERVWVTPETEAETYKVFKAWPAGGVPYVPESRLREVEAERAKDREEYEGREAHFLKQQADVQDALRADLAALAKVLERVVLAGRYINIAPPRNDDANRQSDHDEFYAANEAGEAAARAVLDRMQEGK